MSPDPPYLFVALDDADALAGVQVEFGIQESRGAFGAGEPQPRGTSSGWDFQREAQERAALPFVGDETCDLIEGLRRKTEAIAVRKHFPCFHERSEQVLDERE